MRNTPKTIATVPFYRRVHDKYHTVLITPDLRHSKDDIVEWLTQKAEGDCHFLRESPFENELENQKRKSHYAIQFTLEHDAVHFAAASRGKLLLSDGGKRRFEERLLRYALKRIVDFSRSERAAAVPQLDGIVLAWARGFSQAKLTKDPDSD